MEWGPVSIHRTGGISVSPRGKSSPSDISSVLLLPEASTVPRAGAAAQDLVPEPGISFLAEELMVALTALLPPSSPADWSSAGWASVGICSEASTAEQGVQIALTDSICHRGHQLARVGLIPGTQKQFFLVAPFL